MKILLHRICVGYWPATRPLNSMRTMRCLLLTYPCWKDANKSMCLYNGTSDMKLRSILVGTLKLKGPCGIVPVPFLCSHWWIFFLFFFFLTKTWFLKTEIEEVHTWEQFLFLDSIFCALETKIQLYLFPSDSVFFLDHVSQNQVFGTILATWTKCTLTLLYFKNYSKKAISNGP